MKNNYIRCGKCYKAIHKDALIFEDHVPICIDCYSEEQVDNYFLERKTGGEA